MKARFHLPDFAGHFKFNLVFCELLAKRPDLFREGVEIASFYGVFPPSLWNGGRTQDASELCKTNIVRGASEVRKVGLDVRELRADGIFEFGQGGEADL